MGPEQLTGLVEVIGALTGELSPVLSETGISSSSSHPSPSITPPGEKAEVKYFQFKTAEESVRAAKS